jgi:tetratricopeptide (TPR) repeat protein
VDGTGNAPGSPAEWFGWVEQRCAAAEGLNLTPEQAGQVRLAVLFARGMAHLRLGRSASDSREYSLAVVSLDQLVREQPDYLGGFVYLAQAKILASEDLEQAAKLLERASIWDLPGTAYGWYQMGEAYRKRAERQEDPFQSEDMIRAEAAYARASSFPHALKALGRLLIKRGEIEAGLQKYHEAARIKPNDYDAWDNLAWRTLEAGCSAPAVLFEALQAAHRGLALAGNDEKKELHMHMVIGRVLLALGRVSEAVTELQYAAIRSMQPQFLYFLAQAQDAAGWTKKAIQTLDQALLCDGDPGNRKRGTWQGQIMGLKDTLNAKLSDAV